MLIAVAEGDGIGHEVIPVAQRVLAELRPDFEFFPVEIGYGKWKRTGEALTGDDIAALKSADAVLFGAVTTPPSPDYKSVIVQIRKELDLFANVRPVWGKGFDIVVVRENTEGLYSGVETITADSACTMRCLSRKGCERIAAFASSLAKTRKELTIGHKANVLKSDVFFRDICIGQAQHAGTAWKECYIDALCLDILLHPSRYDVIVTTNLFGDILSDVSAYLVGGLGLLPSANIGGRYALFEPVHGSAPDIAGTNTANPVAAVRSAALLLAHVGDVCHADCIEAAIVQVLDRGVRTKDLGGTAGTLQFGDELIRELQNREKKVYEPVTCL
jgi:methanogen homoisocitrate dehydrogenase